MQIDGVDYKFKIIDTTSKPEYRTLVSTLQQVTNNFVLVFSIDDAKSYEFVENTIEELFQIHSLDLNLIIFGNKCDLEHYSRAVSKLDGNMLALKVDQAIYIEGSAKAGSNCLFAFEELIRIMQFRITEKHRELTQPKKKNSWALFEKVKDLKNSFDDAVARPKSARSSLIFNNSFSWINNGVQPQRKEVEKEKGSNTLGSPRDFDLTSQRASPLGPVDDDIKSVNPNRKSFGKELFQKLLDLSSDKKSRE